jgi:U32 family peptidase
MRKIDRGRQLPELLAPAGSFEKLVTAIHYGADAVYLAGKHYSLRARAANFEAEELQKAVAYAHGQGVRAYVTVNIFAHNEDFAGLPDYLRHLGEIGVDGIIVSDPGILRTARMVIPQVPVHLSTQANITNLESALFWQDQGVSRLNLARELSLSEIEGIRRGLTAEIEIFTHGALCISYSGRCLLSHYLTGRSANQGDCAHPCRYRYALLEEKRPGQYYAVEEDARGAYIFNARDLCLLARLPELLDAGIDSLKIEGRMKGIYYVGGVVRIYRAALDYLAAAAEVDHEYFPTAFLEELTTVGTRSYTENFFAGSPGAGGLLYDAPRASQEHILLGVVKSGGSMPLVEIRNTTRAGERFAYLDRGLQARSYMIAEMKNPITGLPLEQANPGDRILLTSLPPAAGWEDNALLRKTAHATCESSRKEVGARVQGAGAPEK